MFGYIIANQKLLTDEQSARYKGCYCGLCRALKERHGFFGRLTLTYDMTFLVLVLAALYEPEETRRMETCVAHPFRKHFCWRADVTDYAADMNVALAYHNCRDDWQDDGHVLPFWEAELLTKQYQDICARYPRQCGAIERCLAELAELEAANAQEPDAAAACFGALMGELFVMEEGLFEDYLRPFGEALGRFIYTLDAVIDLREDKRTGSYNPLRALDGAGYTAADFKTILTMQLGACADTFERLPLAQDVELLRNILYSGAWQRYEATMAKQKQKTGGTPDERPL